MKRFVYLEFTDPKVRGLLVDLRAALQHKSNAAPIHVTIRGPYETEPDRKKIEELEEQLHGYGVVIGGAGVFEFKNRSYVYLKAQSPLFNEVWWKPDFPVEQYGINPHITVYESDRKESARRVLSFLRGERMEIFTFGIRLSVPEPKQMSLFEINLDEESRKNKAACERWKIKPGLLARAERLGHELATNSAA